MVLTQTRPLLVGLVLELSWIGLGWVRGFSTQEDQVGLKNNLDSTKTPSIQTSNPTIE